MAYAYDAASVWQQLSNLFFLSSGVFNDLLVIRMVLLWAYLFLFLSGLMGFPTWENSFNWSGGVSVDTIVWCCLNIFIQASGVIRIYYDERRIELPEELAMLWRYIYRHSGLSKNKFHSLICPTLRVLTFEAGEAIPTDGMFYILRDGVVGGEVVHQTTLAREDVRLFSGEMFPLKHMHIDYMPRDNVFTRSIFEPVAVTRATLYGIPRTTLKDLSNDHQTKDAWMALLIASLAEIAERPGKKERRSDVSNGDGDAEAVAGDDTTAGRRNPLFLPLHPSEEPDPLMAGSTRALSRPLAHLWKYMKFSFYVPWPIGTWPIGLRQSLYPPKDPKAEKTLQQLSVRELAMSSLRLNVNGGPTVAADEAIVPPV